MKQILDQDIAMHGMHMQINFLNQHGHVHSGAYECNKVKSYR